MMHGREKSDPAIVAMKPTNEDRATGGGAGGAKGGGRGERGPAKHAPDAEPGARDPGAGPRTASRKAKEEGTVHRAPPPRQCRHAPAGVLRAQAQGGPRRGRHDVAGLRGGPRAHGSRICTHGSTGERTGRNRPAGRTYRRRTDGNGRWRSPPWKTRSSRAPTVMVLNAIYEEDFLGFSYGFRPGRGPHDALDALVVGIANRKVNWIFWTPTSGTSSSR